MATTPRPYTWKEAELINGTADETGATFHFYDTEAEMIYPNSGLKYKYGEVPSGHWEELELSDEEELESTSYIFLKGDHPATGSLYLIALDRTVSKDTLYLFRYDYERDVSELVETATLTMQSDNPITQISANVKNVKDALFTSESSLFVPTAKILLGIGYGKSAVYTLATGYMDEVEWKHGAKTVSLSGRNAVGYFLNSQTFDVDKSYKGTAGSILTEIFGLAGITHYEIDDSDSKTIEFEVSANDTFLKGVQVVSDLMSDILNDKIWDVEELYDGTVIAGFATFRGNINPKGFYVFHGKNDVFAKKITRSIDGAFSHVRVTGTDKSNYDLTPSIQEITTWDYWKPAQHRTYHAPKVDGLKDSEELAKYCGILAKQLQKSGKTVNYSTTLRPQLLVGDVAQIQGQEGEDNETLGIITEVKHSFGTKGYMTDFTAASGGVITPMGNTVHTKKKSVNGTDRDRRLSDFMGGDSTLPTQESNNPYEPKPNIELCDFAHFDGRGYIELPITTADITSDCVLSVMFTIDRYVEDMAIFGNETGMSYAHLSTGYFAQGRWITSSGSAMDTFEAPFTPGKLFNFSVNMNGDNIMYYDDVKYMQAHDVGNYTPTGYRWRLWLGYRDGATNKFQGKIKMVRLARINSSGETQDVIMELRPARFITEDGKTKQAGLYDTVNKNWYTCEGLTVDSAIPRYYNFAHFDGSGHIEIPFKIYSFHKYTVWFKPGEMLSGMAVFGNEHGRDYAHLTSGTATGNWITSSGNETAYFHIDTSNTTLGFKFNDDDPERPGFEKNWMYYDNDYHAVTDYTPANYDYKLWIGGCNNSLNFIGDISKFTITNLIDGNTDAEFKPAELYSVDGKLLKRGLWDEVNDMWYTCDGLTLHD